MKNRGYTHAAASRETDLCGLLSTGTALWAKAATIRQQHNVRWAWCIY